MGEQLCVGEPGFARAEARIVLGPAIRKLDDRQRRILELRFIHGWTQQRIGEDIGVTLMQVSRLLTGILAKLRSNLAEPAPGGPRAAERAGAQLVHR